MNFLFLIFVLIDQITKAIFANRDFFLGPVHLHNVNNYALPFNLDLGWGLNFSILAMVYLAVGILMARWDNTTRIMKFGKAMLWAGMASNLADRLVHGFVRDFIDFAWGFVFNLADAFIVIGIVLIIWAHPKQSTNIAE